MDTFAKMDTPDSDIDMLVSFDNDAKISLMKLSRMSIDLEEILGREVDLVPEGSLRPYTEASVNRDKLLIYETECVSTKCCGHKWLALMD